MTVDDRLDLSRWESRPVLPVKPLTGAHIWRARVSEWASQAAVLWLLLDEVERDRAQRFHFCRDRDQYLVAHGLLRLLLGHYVNRNPAGLSYQFGPAGKPYLHETVGASGLQFNLSHSGDIVVMGFCCATEIGVDVEQWNEAMELEQIAGDAFSVAERAELALLPRDQQLAGFFACWSRKEAYLKATGRGIADGLDTFDVSVDPRGPAGLLGERHPAWCDTVQQLFDVAMPSGYSAAGATTRPVSAVALLELVPPLAAGRGGRPDGT